jgi:hypothetical protein
MTKEELDIVLSHTGKHAEEAAMWKDAFDQMCTYFLSHMEGDDLYTDEAYALMRKHNIVDEDGFDCREDK